MDRNRPPGVRILTDEKERGEYLPSGRWVPKLEKPIIDRIIESESSSDMLGAGCNQICNCAARRMKVIAFWELKNLFQEVYLFVMVIEQRRCYPRAWHVVTKTTNAVKNLVSRWRRKRLREGVLGWTKAIPAAL